MNKKIWLIAGLFWTSFFFAQEKWTLDDCMHLVAENSYELMIAQLEQQVIQVQEQSIASYFLPQVGANMAQSFNYGSAINPSTNARVSSNIQSVQTSIDALISLFDWFNYIDRQRKIEYLLCKLTGRRG